MKSKSQFSIATHILLALHYKARETESPWMNSATLAQSVGSHPVVIRRILALLTHAGLIDSKSGRAGGVKLKVNPKNLTLEKVLTAVDSSSPLKQHASPKTKCCPVSCGIGEVMGFVSRLADEAVHQALRRVTVAALLKRMKDAA